MINKASAVLQKIEDKVVIFDICFIPGTRAAHTLHFVNTDGLHIYVDVDDLSLPIAITLIHSPSFHIKYIKTSIRIGSVRRSYGHLLDLATMLIILDEEEPKPIKNPFVLSKDYFDQEFVKIAIRRIYWNDDSV